MYNELHNLCYFQYYFNFKILVAGAGEPVWVRHGEVVVGTTATTLVLRVPQRASIVTVITGPHSAPVTTAITTVMERNHLWAGGALGRKEAPYRSGGGFSDAVAESAAATPSGNGGRRTHIHARSGGVGHSRGRVGR